LDIDDRVFKLIRIWHQWNEKQLDGDTAMLQIGKLFKPYLKWKRKIEVSKKRLKMKEA